eukprot:UN02984
MPKNLRFKKKIPELEASNKKLLDTQQGLNSPNHRFEH